LASMGVLELRFGNPEHAVAFLRRADAAADTDHLRTDVRADLALALLSVGNADEGLPMLHDVQQRYREQARPFDLIQALENERRFHAAAGHDAEIRRVTATLLDIERNTP